VNALDKYLTKLDSLGLSLMVYDGDEVIFKSASKGVRPHLEAIEALGTRLKGTTMVDKIVGRAAALLILYSEAAEVHAGVVSRGGREVLERSGMPLFFDTETEHIKMVDGRIYCPFEAMVQGIDDPTKAYHAVVEKMADLKKAK
jgi:hypothetical protein